MRPPAAPAPAWAVPWEAWTPDATRVHRSRGLALEVWDWGSVADAREVVVCAHGYLDCAGFFGGLAALLRDALPDVAVRAFSFAGHGGSDHADAYAWSDHTVDLVGLLRATRREAPRATLTLLGHSFGGVHVVGVAHRQPTLVDRVVDLDAVARPSAPRPLPPSGVVEERAFRSRGALASYPSLAELSDRRVAANPRLDPTLVRRLVGLLARGSDEEGWTWRVDPLLVGWVRPWDAAPGAPGDPVPVLRRLRQPTLVVTGGGEDHPLVRGEYPGDDAFAGVAGLVHVPLADAGHYVHLEQPAAVATAIATFLGRAG